MDSTVQMGPQFFQGNRLDMFFRASDQISADDLPPDIPCPQPLVRLSVTLFRSFLMTPCAGSYHDLQNYINTDVDADDTFLLSSTSRVLYFNMTHMTSEQNLEDMIFTRIFLPLPMSLVVATVVFQPVLKDFLRWQIDLALQKGQPTLDLSVLFFYQPILVAGRVTEEVVQYFRGETEDAAFYAAMMPGELWVPRWYEKLERFDLKEEDQVTDTTADECAVCMTEFEESQTKKLARLPCRHVFHEDCIEKWLLINNKCPLCRCLL